MIVGLTGGIACGKSTVAGMFEELGCIIIDADLVAREVVQPGEEGLLAIVEHFGRDVLTEDGELNRKALGSIIFADENKRQELGSILHPLIRKRMEQKKREAIEASPPLIIMDIPLLYESKLQHTVETVVVVYVSEEIQLTRLMERNGFTREEAVQRIVAQIDIEDKKEMADYVIDNSSSIENTRIQVDRLFSKLCKDT